MSIHGPFVVISIGVGVETGSALVPEDVWAMIESIKLPGFMTMGAALCFWEGWLVGLSVHPGICIPGIHGEFCCAVAFAGAMAARTQMESTAHKTRFTQRVSCGKPSYAQSRASNKCAGLVLLAGGGTAADFTA